MTRILQLMKVWPHPNDNVEPEGRLRMEFFLLLALPLLLGAVLIASHFAPIREDRVSVSGQ